MAKAKKVRAKGKKRGPLRKTSKGKLIGVRVMPSLLARIDEWASKQDGEVSRPDAMRRLIERGLSPGARKSQGPSARAPSKRTGGPRRVTPPQSLAPCRPARLKLMPDWMATVAGFNPLTWAADASRSALDGTGDATYIALRLGWLAAFLLASTFLALRAFGRYRRSI